MKHCKVCGTEIPAGRLKAVPGTQTCTQHSNASKFTANVVQNGTLEGDGFQELDIVRSAQAQEQLEYYKSQLGRYQ